MSRIEALAARARAWGGAVRERAPSVLRRELGAIASRRNLALYVALGLVVRAAWDVRARLAYEYKGPINDDAPIFAAMGRGILNHIPLYTGLFETKPPIVFLLFALSEKLTRSYRLVTGVEVAALVAVMLVPIALVLRYRHALPDLGWRLLGACLGGSLLLLYTAERAGQLQVESFGAAFLLPWVWVWARPPGVSTHGWGRLVVGAVSVACATLTKEPFVLVALAVGLLSARSRKDARDLAAMLVLGGGIACLALVVTGAARGYFGTYLNEMLFHTAFTDEKIDTSRLLDKGFDWARFHDATDFAPAAAVVFLAAAWVAMSQQRAASSEPWGWILTRWWLALVLGSLAVSLSGRYYPHHFVCVVPCALSVLVAWLLSGPEPAGGEVTRFASAAALLGLVTTTLVHTRTHPEDGLETMRTGAINAATAAHAIDQALTCMHEERWVFIGKNGVQPWGWTEHSPVGPFFFQYQHWFDKEPAHREQLFHELDGSRLLVLWGYSAGNTSAVLKERMEARFRPGLPAECSSLSIPLPWAFWSAKPR